MSETENKRLLAELRSQRGTAKGQQTKMKTFIETNKAKLTLSELETRLGLLEGYFVRFNEIQAKIECVCVEEAVGDERDKYEDIYCAIKSDILTLISEKKGPQSPTLGASGFDSYASGTRAIRAHIPKISLPKFTGKFTEWPEFYAIFKALIHEDTDLTNVEKFSHLRSCLSGAAILTIDSLEITTENYLIAIKLLEGRFQNKRLLFQSHINDIFNIRAMENLSAARLRYVSDSVKAHIRAMQSIGTDKQLIDNLLVYLVCRKCDTETQTKWEEECSADEIPSWENFAKFLERRCQTLENMDYSRLNKPSKTSSIRPVVDKVKYNHKNSSFTVSKGQVNCSYCKNADHIIFSCPTFLHLSPENRFIEAKRMALCINCLRVGHQVKACKSGKCRHCDLKHNSLLHRGSSTVATHEDSPVSPTSYVRSDAVMTSSPITQSGAVAIKGQEQGRAVFTSNSEEIEGPDYGLQGNVFLATAVILVKSATGDYLPCRALLDSASQLNFVTECLAQRLRAKRVRSNFSITGIGETKTIVKHKTDLNIKSRLNKFSSCIEALIIPHISCKQPTRLVSIEDWKIPRNIPLADPSFYKPQVVDILLGAGLFFELLSVGQIRLGPGLPTLQKTVLGWIVSGTVAVSVAYTSCHMALQDTAFDNNSLESVMKSFWEVEAHMPSSNAHVSNCEQHFMDNYIRDDTGRFWVKLPFNDSPTKLGNSLDIAKKRFFKTEQRLNRFPELKQQYTQFLQEYLSQGHMEKVNFADLRKNHYFLPHHSVLKPESSSTKLRVVFDASCKTTSGYSLNDLLMVGPVIQDDLFSHLLRFRSYKYAITADISKMYRQVRLQASDCNYHCILWRASVDQPVNCYRLLTVTYGTAPASFLATRCLKQLAFENSSEYPIGSRVLEQNFYMDDMLSGGNTVEETIQIQNEIQGIMNSGGFALSKWCASDPLLLATIDEDHREKYLQIKGDKVVKTLGMIWQPQSDNFCFTYRPFDMANSQVTKRTVLSSIARLFDPLGLLSPIIIKAKIFIQRLWNLSLRWDESLPQELHSEWTYFYQQLPHVDEFKVPRHIILEESRVELHGFADASMSAYGACIYARCTSSQGGVSCHLISSKSRVAPLKVLSIPRLELCAAVLLAELLDHIYRALKINVERVFCWSDSTIVLAWISSAPSRWCTFVSNRVSKVQELTRSFQWRYIPSKSNPADLISRGMLPKALVESRLWLNGPDFLCSNEPWPALINISTSDVPEKRKEQTVLLIKVDDDLVEEAKFRKSYRKLINVFAYVIRFYNCCKAKTQSSHKKFTGELTITEIDFALKAIIRMIQIKEFSNDYSHLRTKQNLKSDSSLRALSPFIDDNGLIRVGGRITNSNLGFDARHPILLPKGHCFTKALIMHYHYRNLHAGCQMLLSIIRTRFWPISGRSIVKQVIARCLICFRTRPRALEQIMGHLPKQSVQPSRPFSCAGVDFCGPFSISSGIRGRGPTKAYICIFVCLAIKAVHLEVVCSLTTDGFLAALRRFIGRRGKPSLISSDNATNFVGANRELMDLKALWHSQHHAAALRALCQAEGIEWQFIPPRSPHMGGLWEAAVKLTKNHLRRVSGLGPYTLEELQTLTCQIEAVLNSRPLTPLSEDPNDLQVLTPGHFLTGAPLISIAEPCMPEEKLNYINRWQRVQAAAQHFWRRWSCEYLQSLQGRCKWRTKQRNIKVGTLVLLMEQNTPSLHWPLGRIVDLHPGRDGFVRVVSVKA